MPDTVTGGELVTGILKGADLASTIVNAMSAIQDMTQARDLVKYTKMDIADLLKNLQDLNLKCTKDGYHILQQSILDVQNWLPHVIDETNNIALAARQGWQATANMMRTRLNIYTEQRFLENAQYMLYGLPQAILKQKAAEWYMSAYRPSNPSEQLTIEQFVRGHITAEQAANYLAIKGVPSELMFMLYDHYEKYPSVREMALASEFTAVTDAQLLDAMKYDNITLTANRTFYLNYAHAIQLRTEFNQYIVQLKTDYVNGLMSEADFIDEIELHKPNAIEAAQIVENANKQKIRNLLNMEIQSLTWLYRKGEFGEPATDGAAELAFYESLNSIMSDEATANAIARFEACKLGYNWERE